jgi:hypothetical protein
MDIRSVIRGWLGIDNIELRQHEVLDRITESRLKQIVGSAVMDLIDGCGDGDYGWRSRGNISYPSRFTECINKQAKGISKETAIDTVKDIVDRELFIDQVVERINKKRVVS